MSSSCPSVVYSASSCSGTGLQARIKGRELSQSVSSAMVAGPHPTTLAHENVLSVTPNPLRVPVMLASVVLVLLQVIDYLVECILADMDIGIGRHLLIYRLDGHFLEPILVPERALTCFPNQTTHIAKFASAAANH
ncbi:hypothetical protein N7516_001001 [Penicillium verrucosum]|uniref:uncharacterized protein n=1 Tax=Penicillium verrucosum TaxID=60171 RepID=UPI002545369A|nr:uncharacterized protein N7516_001001 [Penicillium verrucosum]KAJ5940833.1 hypothetical protein N7516_001001 [Penicillium verrucosum]